jgi:hypothetical protein
VISTLQGDGQVLMVIMKWMAKLGEEDERPNPTELKAKV